MNAPLYRAAGTLIFKGKGHGLTPSTLAAAKTALLYALAAVLWIVLSDRLLFLLADPETIQRAGIYKGAGFVGITGLILFLHLRRQFKVRHGHENTLLLFIHHAPVALAILGKDLRYITVSDRWIAQFAKSKTMHRDSAPGMCTATIPERWKAAAVRALAGETISEEMDHTGDTPDGCRWLQWEARPWLDEDGAIGGIVIFAEDITARKEAEAALAASQARMQLALECAHMGTWSWDIGSGNVDCDEGFARVMGRTSSDLASGGWKLFKQCIHPEDRVEVARAISVTLERGAPFAVEYRIIRPDGSILWVANRASVEWGAEGNALRMIGACADVTDIKRIQNALNQSEDRFREVVETIREVFWIRSIDRGELSYVSPAYEDIWGRDPQELYRSREEWVLSIHPEDRKRIQLAAQDRQVNGTFDETYRIVRPDQGIRWVHDRAYPVKDENGNVIRIIGTAEDVTERIQLEEQFLRAQRLEAIGSLASGVAHDLNNILAPMMMIAPILETKLTTSTDRDLLSIVERCAQRGSEVLRQLLTFSRGMSGEKGPLQLRHLVKEMIQIMNETFPREIGIVHDIPTDLDTVVGDSTQLHQVLMNLCVNARDAMPDGGKLSISAQHVHVTEKQLRGHPHAKPGKYVMVSVTDTGHGIPSEIRTRIFEPFFTTKGQGKGTGLGLSTVVGIVRSHAGFVTLESEMGRGTSFHVHLPASAKLEQRGAAMRVPIQAGDGELILIVDDEESLRMAMEQVLARNGYNVLLARDGREALQMFLAHRLHVRAVVTDLMMPEMGGMALVRALREMSPSLPILGSTGLEETGQRETLRELGVNALLPKPYTPAELLDALKHELEWQRKGAAATT